MTARLFSDGSEAIGVSLGKVAKVRPRELGLRFVLGFVISVVAGVITVVGGPKLGGMFLAFPSILPASLTLLAKRHGRRAAELEARGSVLGAVALAAFAGWCWLAFERLAPPVVLLGGLVVWIAGAVLLYRATRRLPRPDAGRVQPRVQGQP
jgi:uncharacterized membrane protein (GlpM family)